MGGALEIRTDVASAARLPRLARRERSPRTASRMLAIAGALEGLSRAEAARLAGMERQALRNAVARYNAEGLDGLRDRPKPGRTPTPSEAEQAVLLDAVFRGADRAEDGGSDWSLPMLCRWIERRFDKRMHPASLSRVLRRLDLSRSFVVPPNITLAPLPPYAPELNPVERVWLLLRERLLSHRLLDSYDGIVSACCEAWNALTPERLRSLCAFPWLAKVSS